MNAADVAPAEDIRTVGSDHVAQLAAITADAFRHDPFNKWLFGNFNTMHRVFTTLAKHVYAPKGFCQLMEEGGEGHAATMWLMPGVNGDTPPAGMLSLYWDLFSGGGFAALKRGKAAGEAMAAHHPKEPHAYLFTVGVMQASRGHGLGRRLVEPVLAACDRTGTMAYLENSNPANTGVYKSLGFETIEMIEPVPGCPPLEAMQRPAR